MGHCGGNSFSGELEVLDLQGRTRYTGEYFGENRISLDTEQFSAGIYIIRLKEAAVTHHIKILVE